MVDDQIKVTHDNNGRFYRIKMDLAKEGSELWDLTPYFKGRVGDNRFGLQVVWTNQGRLLDTTGMKPYIEGNVGNYSFDDKKNLQLATDAATVRYTGNPSDCQSGGRVTYYFPEQMFPRDGIFKGYIGLLDDRDDSSQPHISGVTVWFRVLPGIAQMGYACDVYISDLDKALQNFKVKLDQHDKDYQTQLQQVIDDARNTYNSETKNIHDALLAKQAEVEANRSEQKILSNQLDDYEKQIERGNIVRKDEFQAGNDALSNSINAKLLQINTNPEAFNTEDELKTKYPNGKSGLFFVGETKHLYIYDQGWKDIGEMPMQGLTDEQKNILSNAIYNQIFIYSQDQLKAPYTDLDLYPANTVVCVGTDTTDILHKPDDLTNEGLTVMTYGPSDTAHGTIKDGTVQILVTEDGRKFWRIRWQLSFTEWRQGLTDEQKSILNNSIYQYDFIYSEKQLKAPYNNLNLYPANTVISIGTDSSSIINTPPIKGKKFYEGFTVITYGPASTSHGETKDGAVQLLLSQYGELYWRILWNSNWSEWIPEFRPNQKFFSNLDDINAPYDDLDTFPANASGVYAVDASKIRNSPESNNAFTIKTWGIGNNDTQSGTVQLFNSRNGGMYVRTSWGGEPNFSAWKQIKAETQEETEFDYAKPSLAMFGKFGVVGDSYASGVLEDFEHNQKDTFAQMTPEMTENLSWPTMLARKWGTSMLHLAKGGLSTRTWLTDDQGLKKLNESDPQDIYYLCLGINDYYGLGDSYLGIESDMESGADSFYGNYAKIIKAIKAKAPLAKIIMFGIAITPGDSHDRQMRFSDAQYKIAQHFGIPYISENDDVLFNSDYYLKSMGSGHPSSYLYGAIAEAFERLIQRAIYKNRDYFYSYGWNGAL